VTHRPLSPRLIVAVAVGAALGAALRHLLSELTPASTGFPWTTFAINVSGAFLLASLPAIAAVRERQVVTLALGPGLLGGYTTLSAYAEDSRALLADAQPGLAAAYLLGTLAACLVAVAVAQSFSTPAEQQFFADEEGDE
jgi:CrcB protein